MLMRDAGSLSTGRMKLILGIQYLKAIGPAKNGGHSL